MDIGTSNSATERFRKWYNWFMESNIVTGTSGNYCAGIRITVVTTLISMVATTLVKGPPVKINLKINAKNLHEVKHNM